MPTKHNTTKQSRAKLNPMSAVLRCQLWVTILTVVGGVGGVHLVVAISVQTGVSDRRPHAVAHVLADVRRAFSARENRRSGKPRIPRHHHMPNAHYIY